MRPRQPIVFLLGLSLGVAITLLFTSTRKETFSTVQSESHQHDSLAHIREHVEVDRPDAEVGHEHEHGHAEDLGPKEAASWADTHQHLGIPTVPPLHSTPVFS